MVDGAGLTCRVVHLCSHHSVPVNLARWPPRILIFNFPPTQAYIIEFGNLYARFYKDNGSITLTTQAITGITKANPAVVTYTGADTYANTNHILITGVLGMTEVNNREFTVANVDVGA